jgi:transcription elongation GreA/GreB family factor
VAASPEAVGAAIQRLETAKADLGDRAKLHLSLGVLYLRKQDVAGAERAFQEAVAKEPKSAEAHLALGDFYLGKRDVVPAERELKTAADLAPVGSKVKLRDVAAKETIEYHIVGSAEANPAENKLSNESPVGKAIIGKKKGETVEVAAPRGKMKFKIMEIKAA